MEEERFVFLCESDDTKIFISLADGRLAMVPQRGVEDFSDLTPDESDEFHKIVDLYDAPVFGRC